MKKLLLFVCLFLLYFNVSSFAADTDKGISGGLKVQCSPELSPLVSRLISEYNKTNPNVKLFFLEGKPELLPGKSQLLILSDGSLPVSPDSLWKMAICRDALVPVINSQNPDIKNILEKGISPEAFGLLKNREGLLWGKLLNDGSNAPVHYLQINDEAIKIRLAGFLNTDTSSILVNAADAKRMISIILSDPLAIGFCPVTSVMDQNHKNFISGITILPIDKNGNGHIDSFENIYGNVNDFLHGVWIGKFPSALCSNIYAVKDLKDDNGTQFLKWILKDGQSYLNAEGYLDLGSTEKEAKLSILGEQEKLVQSSESNSSLLFTIITCLVIVTIITGVVISYRNNKKASEVTLTTSSPTFTPKSLTIPRGVYFDKTHTWVFMERDGNVRVGIDDFLPRVTGSVTKVILKEPGEKVRKGEKIFSLMHEGKQISVGSPVSGIIRELNPELDSDTGIINRSPFGEGWVYVIEPENWLRETEFLFMAEKYSSWIGNEFSRLKDFLASSFKSEKIDQSGLVLQDGGELRENVLADLEPEIWEDFQTAFIEKSH